MKAVVRQAFPRERRYLVLLLLALSVVFVAGGDSQRFYQWDYDHGGIALNHLTVAGNRSYEHGFLGFYHQFIDVAGERAYAPYNRFPMLGSLLIKAAIAPFPDDVAAQIQAARMLMLACFAAAAVAAYLALRRLARPAVALAATLLAFSSYYPLRYADLIATEGPMDLLALMLAFHALVVFVQEGRTGQFLAKTGIAALIGWHSFALLAPFFVLGLAAEWLRDHGSIVRRSARLLHSRQLLLGTIALSFGLSMLALNFALESTAHTGSGAVWEQQPELRQMPSYRAVLRVFGLRPDFNEQHKDQVAWQPLLEKLMQRSGRVFVPFCVEHLGRVLLADAPRPSPPFRQDRQVKSAEDGAEQRPVESGGSRRSAGGNGLLDAVALLAGVVACLAGAVAVAFSRQRILLGSLAACGLGWGLLVRGSVPFNAFEGMFQVGLPLVVYLAALLKASRWSPRLANGCAGLALLVFVLSSLAMWRADHAPGAEFRSLMSDIETIRSIAAEGTAVVGYPPTPPIRYLLTGRILLPSVNGAQRQRADFVLARGRTASDGGLLTPNNRHLFLFDRNAFDARYATLGEPAISGGRGWNVHWAGHRLIYTSGEGCEARQAYRDEPPFFLEVFPARSTLRSRSFFQVPGRVRRSEFRFHESGFEVAGRCVAELVLQAYDVAKVRTGQFLGQEVLWADEAVGPRRP